MEAPWESFHLLLTIH